MVHRPDILLTRAAFRDAVFGRDGHVCVVCGAPAQDAHHIIERRLWPDGGYYIDNGASLCAGCHVSAEQTSIDCDELRTKCGIEHVVLPPHLYRDQAYDKWGNPIQSNGTRLKGELFDDPSVQRALGAVLHLFVSRVKYARTYHVPWSPGATRDDRIVALDDVPHLCSGETELVVTEKMDGENTTMYRDGMHARSLDYEPHPSRDWVKRLHATFAHDIPEGWRVCGENLYAKHSIGYDDLPSYLMVFSVWDGTNTCLSWDDTVEWCTLLGLCTVPVLYRGPWDTEAFRRLETDRDRCEGYVIRPQRAFHYSAFRKNVLKYVRAHHVQTHGHWMRSAVVPNGLYR